MTPEVVSSEAHLFEPRPAYRFREITRPSTPYDDPPTGENPEYGASINYWMKGPAEEPPTLTVKDADGEVVRTIEGSNHAGVNRVHWDLRDESNDPIHLYTSPMYAEHIQVTPEGRPAPGGSRISVLMPPGEYTVTLSLDGQEMERNLRVLKDPNTAGSESDIAAQVAFVREVREDLVRAGEAVHQVEALRVQLKTLLRFSEDDEVTSAAKALEEKLEELQMEMVDLRLTGQGQDGVRFGAKLLQKFGYLTRGVSVADFPPTDQDLEVKGILHDALADHLEALGSLLTGDVADFNALLTSKGMGLIGG
jgi:hypothetical protein